MREEQIGLVRRSTGKVSARDKKRKEKRSDGEEIKPRIEGWRYGKREG